MRASRAGVLTLTLLVLGALPLAPASAELADCVTLETASFAERLRIIAHGGRQIALGFATPAPGDGVSMVAYISPTLCTGIGLPSPITATSGEPVVVVEAPSYPGLP